MRLIMDWRKCLKCGSIEVEDNHKLLDLGDSAMRFIKCKKCGATTQISYDNPHPVEYED